MIQQTYPVEIEALFGLLTLIGIALVIPGPNALTCFAHSGIYGPKSNIKLIIGMIIGFVTIELTIGLIIDSLKESNTAMLVFHWIGMAFLTIVVVSMYRINPADINSKEIDGALGLKTGITMQFINGKEWAFLIIAMSQFIEPLGGGLTGISTIIVVTVTSCTIAMVLWTFAGSRLSNMFSDPVKGPMVFKTSSFLLSLLLIRFLIQGPVSV